ncbi:MAG: isochorismatase family protein [Candidatus Aenigmatarchaeota archaeon]|nr:MAG: isochorismatase family protein [Candidatus Aenigmarchaeota archaeon]
MRIPDTGRRRALIVVDVQPAFVNRGNRHVIQNIRRLLDGVDYNLYAEALFHAERGGIWDRQQKWTCPRNAGFFTVPVLAEALRTLGSVRIEKETKSAFKGKPDLAALFRKHKIDEVHVAGYDTNDCIIATAYEAFDLGMFTYVIEECVESSSTRTLHKEALALLRHQNMTNNSCVERAKFRRVPLPGPK